MSYHGRFEQQKQPKGPDKKSAKGGKGLKIFLIVLAVLLALVLIAAAVVYWYVQNKFSKMNVITLPEDTYVYTEATDEYTYAIITLEFIQIGLLIISIYPKLTSFSTSAY